MFFLDSVMNFQSPVWSHVTSCQFGQWNNIFKKIHLLSTLHRYRVLSNCCLCENHLTKPDSQTAKEAKKNIRSLNKDKKFQGQHMNEKRRTDVIPRFINGTCIVPKRYKYCFHLLNVHDGLTLLVENAAVNSKNYIDYSRCKFFSQYLEKAIEGSHIIFLYASFNAHVQLQEFLWFYENCTQHSFNSSFVS